MSRTRKTTVMSAIDIGSYSLKMKIVEINEAGQARTIEKLVKPAALGRDTFSMGKVSYETVEKACNIFTGFLRLMQEYQSKHYIAVATSAIREAQNRDYLLDQIKNKTGLDVKVLTNAQERYLTYKAIREKLPDFEAIRKEGVMVVEVGSGSIEITVYSHGILQRTHNIKLGHLRLREVLSSLEERTQDFPTLLEEYVESHLDIIKFIRERYQLNNFIALGSEMRVISKLCNHTDQSELIRFIPLEDFNRFFEKILEKPIPLLARDYGLPLEIAATLLPSMMVLKKCLEMTHANCIYTPLISLSDGIVADFIDKRFKTPQQQEFLEDVQHLVQGISRKYHVDLNHALDVEKKAVIIFDALKTTYGMKKWEKHLLRLAVKLHDIGKFVNLNEHYIHTYNLIKASEILGLTEEEHDIVANVARYHSSQIPHQSHDNYWQMPSLNRVITAKLVAIIRVADSLDDSHRQKISNLSITLKGDDMIIKGQSMEETLLEEWAFEMKSEFFKEVFGIRPQLKVRRELTHAENT